MNRFRQDVAQKRVLMLTTFEDTRNGGRTIYHGGNEFNVDPDVFDIVTASGAAVPVVNGEPVFPQPEPEPEPQPAESTEEEA